VSYFFRQRQIQAHRERVEKDGLNAALNRAVEFAHRVWDESKVNRGKTTPESRGGSFAPRAAVEGQRLRTGRKWTSEVAELLQETQQTTYRKLYQGELKSHKDADAYAQAKMKKWMGPGYEMQVSEMVDRVWDEFRRNNRAEVHNYRTPDKHLVDGWAVKTDAS